MNPESLEKARNLRNYYAHAEYDCFFKGDLISISTISNKRTGMMERCMRYFTNVDIEEDLNEIINAIDRIDEVKSQIDKHSNTIRN